MKKSTVIEMLNSFGNEFAIESLIEQLLFLDNIEQGLKDAETGKLIGYNEAKQSFRRKNLNL